MLKYEVVKVRSDQLPVIPNMASVPSTGLSKTRTSPVNILHTTTESFFVAQIAILSLGVICRLCMMPAIIILKYTYEHGCWQIYRLVCHIITHTLGKGRQYSDMTLIGRRILSLYESFRTYFNVPAFEENVFLISDSVRDEEGCLEHVHMGPKQGVQKVAKCVQKLIIMGAFLLIQTFQT